MRDIGGSDGSWLRQRISQELHCKFITKRSRPELGGALAVEHAERLELAVERRALHTDEGPGARYVAAEARHLRQQIFALEHLAGVAQRQCHALAALVPSDDGGRDRADL